MVQRDVSCLFLKVEGEKQGFILSAKRNRKSDKQKGKFFYYFFSGYLWTPGIRECQPLAAVTFTQ